MNGAHWTTDEDALLREKWQDTSLSLAEIGKMMRPVRSKNAVNSRCKRLGLPDRPERVSLPKSDKKSVIVRKAVPKLSTLMPLESLKEI